MTSFLAEEQCDGTWILSQTKGSSFPFSTYTFNETVNGVIVVATVTSDDFKKLDNAVPLKAKPGEIHALFFDSGGVKVAEGYYEPTYQLTNGECSEPTTTTTTIVHPIASTTTTTTVPNRPVPSTTTIVLSSTTTSVGRSVPALPPTGSSIAPIVGLGFAVLALGLAFLAIKRKWFR